jgi:hypothetical protein
MPIKELVTFGMGIVVALAVAKGPWNLKRSMLELEYKIAKEVTRTDNWGNPSIFKNEYHEKR